MSRALYYQAVIITSDYLGPVAERFINRQLSFHLGKTPEQLTRADVPLLAEWVKVSITILTEDENMVDEFSERILELAE